MEQLRGNFPYKRIVVTGGAGFLGRFILERLQDYPDLEIFAPRRSNYDLVKLSDIKRLLSETRPDLIVHLAGVVGGIGANQKKPENSFMKI